MAAAACRVSALLGFALLLLSWPANGASNAARGGRPFTALHVYYISPNGNDSHAGTSLATAWATPNHAVACGDVIVAAVGDYRGWQDGAWGAVSNCPSTSGGIDGTGGVQFAVVLCAGSLGSCRQNGRGAEAIRINQSHWAVEGWVGTQNPDAISGCFSGENDQVEQKYIAFINDIAKTCDLDGFGVSGGGGPAGSSSFDYIAAVGVISFNGANSISPYCGSGISFAPGNGDEGAGTHVFISGYFGAYNTNASGPKQCAVSGNSSFPHSDGEGIIFDSYGGGYAAGGFTKQAVLEDAVIWRSGNACVEVAPSGKPGTDLAQYVISNVTCYANNQDPLAFCGAELLLNGIKPSGPGAYTITNNIFQATELTCGGAARPTPFMRALAQATGGAKPANPVYAAQIAETNKAPGLPTVSIQKNYIWQSHPPTTTTVGPPNTLVYQNGVRNSAWNYGPNAYDDPGLKSPDSLFSSSPDCRAYDNVTECMLTGYHVYANVKPTLAPATMGYRPPRPCAPDEYYPTWLKGIVYLRWSESGITENDGLISKPCGM